METGWIIIFLFAGLVNPLPIITGIICGICARRWWHLFAVFIVFPFILTLSAGRFDFHIGMIFFAVAALIWAASVYAMKAIIRAG